MNDYSGAYGPKTKEVFIAGEQLLPSVEVQRKIFRIMLRTPHDPLWGGMGAYELGFIHGQRAERERKKAHATGQGKHEPNANTLID